MDRDSRLHHHDIALCENPNLPKPPAEWSMFDQPVAINHIAITMPNREAWLKQLAWLRAKGVEVWGDNIQGAIDYAEDLPIEGPRRSSTTRTTRYSAPRRRRTGRNPCARGHWCLRGQDSPSCPARASRSRRADHDHQTRSSDRPARSSRAHWPRSPTRGDRTAQAVPRRPNLGRSGQTAH
jgi:hypothetical protein